MGKMIVFYSLNTEIFVSALSLKFLCVVHTAEHETSISSYVCSINVGKCLYR